MKTLIIDNYDSFTYNLYQYVGELKGNPLVFRNDKIDLAKIIKLKPAHIMLSPGPGTPEKRADFGVCGDVIQALVKHKINIPVLGICLGHQGIINELGGKIITAPKIMHGKTDLIKHTNQGIFKNIKNPLVGMRYHSLVGEKKSLPDVLEITAQTTDGTIMAVQHKALPLFGIQFHPESVGTDEGKKMLRNFLKTKKKGVI